MPAQAHMLKSMFQVECLAFVLEFDQKMDGIDFKGEDEAVSEKRQP